MLTTVLLVVLLFVAARPATRNRVGIALGEPSGVNILTDLSTGDAMSAVVGWSFDSPEGLHFHLDYLMGDRIGSRGYGSDSPLYNGIGIAIKAHDRGGGTLSARFPFGLVLGSRERSYQMFFEVVPLLTLARELEGSFQASVGLRFSFGAGAT